LIDLCSSWTVNKENILYKCSWSPMEGQTFTSRVTHTILNGHIVFENGIVDEKPRGMKLTFNR
jgi:dihydroorotase